MTDQALRNTLQNYLLVSVAEFESFMVSKDCEDRGEDRTCSNLARDPLRMNLNFVRLWTIQYNTYVCLYREPPSIPKSYM